MLFTSILYICIFFSFHITIHQQQNLHYQTTDKAKDDIRLALNVLNLHLATRTFLVGERISLADVTVVCHLTALYQKVCDYSAHQHIIDVDYSALWLITLHHHHQNIPTTTLLFFSIVQNSYNFSPSPQHFTITTTSHHHHLTSHHHQVLDPDFRKDYPHVNRWFTTLVDQPNFKAVLGTITLCTKQAHPDGVCVRVRVCDFFHLFIYKCLYIFNGIPNNTRPHPFILHHSPI